MPAVLSFDPAQPRRRHERRSLMRALAWSDGFAMTSLALCLATFFAFAFGFTPLLRPLHNQTIHPVAALGAALLALAVLLAYRRDLAGTALRRLYCGSVFVAMLGRLLFEPVVAPWFDYLVPASLPLAAGSEPALSGNSALCLLLLSGALMLHRVRDALFSQALAFVAYGLPTLSLIGYLMGIGQFHGRMSLTTVLILIPLCASVLLSTVRHGFLRQLLGGTRISALARNYLLLIMLLPYFFGFALMHESAPAAGLPIAMLIVATSQLVGLCICFFVLASANIEMADQAAMRVALTAAQRDALTGAFNRRYFLERAERVMAQARSDESRASLLFIDIDHFKRVNDTHGHAVGDIALQRTFALARECLRRDDIIARWGGEEFVVMLPGADSASAGQVAENIRRHVADTAIVHDGGELRITISLGCVQFEGAETLQQLIERADRALYRAKELGRNRTVMG